MSGAGALKFISKGDDLVDAVRAVDKIDDAVDTGKGIAKAVNTISDVNKVQNGTSALKYADEGYDFLKSNKNAVIGKLDDLKKIGPNEYTLLDQMPNLGNPKSNWKQNSSVLRKEMRRGVPIRDASVYNPNGNTGFLRAERNLLLNHGWILDGVFWRPGIM